MRTAEREQLAKAIKHHAAALDAVRRVSQAREQADEVVYRARDILDAAEAKLKEAQANEGAYLAAVALGEDAGVSAADAEAAVMRATNDLAIARRTRDALDERAQREASEGERAKDDIDKCISAVVQTEANVARLLAEAKAMQDDLVAKRVALRFLFNNDLVAEPEVRDFMLFQHTLPVGRGQLERGNYNAHPAS